MVIFEIWPERFAGGCRGLQPLRDTRFEHSPPSRVTSASVLRRADQTDSIISVSASAIGSVRDAKPLGISDGAVMGSLSWSIMLVIKLELVAHSHTWRSVGFATVLDLRLLGGRGKCTLR